MTDLAPRSGLEPDAIRGRAGTPSATVGTGGTGVTVGTGPRAGTRARTWLAVGVVVACAAGVVAWRVAARKEVPAIVAIERNGLRYSYHVQTGHAFLWDLSVPESERDNLIKTRPADALRLRKELEKELDVEDLDVLHEPYRERAKGLHGLGYL